MATGPLTIAALAANSLKGMDNRVLPLLLADVLLTPLMETSAPVASLDTIVRDTAIRFASLFLVDRVAALSLVKTAIERSANMLPVPRGEGFGVVVGLLALHTTHVLLLRLIGLPGTSVEEDEPRGPISQRLMARQLGVPVVPLADLAIMVGASAIAGMNIDTNLMGALVLYVFALGGRRVSAGMRTALVQSGVPVPLAGAVTVGGVLLGLAVGGGTLSRVLGIRLQNISSS